jgi:hypothetical protein
MTLKYCSLPTYKEACLILILTLKIYFNMLTSIGKNSNLIFLKDLTLQEEGYLQNGVLKKILGMTNLILRCSNHGLDLELFALTLKLIQTFLCIMMVFIIDTLLWILILIYAIQLSLISVKVIKKLRNFYQISIFSYGLIMNILISRNIKKDQHQKVSLTKIKFSQLLRTTTPRLFR